MIVTAQLLRDRGACGDAVHDFRCRFPTGARVTVARCLANADNFNWDWASVFLVPGGKRNARRAFNRLTRVTRDDYHEASQVSPLERERRRLVWRRNQACAFALLVRYPTLRETVNVTNQEGIT